MKKMITINKSKELSLHPCSACEETRHLTFLIKDADTVIGEINAYPETANEYRLRWMLNGNYGEGKYGYKTAFSFWDSIFRETDATRIQLYVGESDFSCRFLCETLGMQRVGMFLGVSPFPDDADETIYNENLIQYAISSE